MMATDPDYSPKKESTGRLCHCGEEIVREIHWIPAPIYQQVDGPGGPPPREHPKLVCPGCGLIYDRLGPNLGHPDKA